MDVGDERGTVKATLPKGFGFITRPGQIDLFFHASDLAPGLEFDESLIERDVMFSIEHTDRGPRARDVRPAT